MTDHPHRSGVHVVLGEIVGADPADRLGFVVPPRAGAGGGDDQMADVEVQVGPVGGRVHLVDVEIDGDGVDAQAGDARLLGRLTQGDRSQVGVTVAVPSGLQPSLQLRVEEQEHVLGLGVDHDRRAGEVATPTGSMEGVVMGGDEVEDGHTVAFGVPVDVGGLDGRDRVGQRRRRPQVLVIGFQHGPDTTPGVRKPFPPAGPGG